MRVTLKTIRAEPIVSGLDKNFGLENFIFVFNRGLFLTLLGFNWLINKSLFLCRKLNLKLLSLYWVIRFPFDAKQKFTLKLFA